MTQQNDRSRKLMRWNWHEATLLAIDAFIGLMIASLIHGAMRLLA